MAGLAVALPILSGLDMSSSDPTASLTDQQNTDLTLALGLLEMGATNLSPTDPMYGALSGLLGGMGA